MLNMKKNQKKSVFSVIKVFTQKIIAENCTQKRTLSTRTRSLKREKKIKRDKRMRMVFS